MPDDPIVPKPSQSVGGPCEECGQPLAESGICYHCTHRKLSRLVARLDAAAKALDEALSDASEADVDGAELNFYLKKGGCLFPGVIALFGGVSIFFLARQTGQSPWLAAPFAVVGLLLSVLGLLQLLARRDARARGEEAGRRMDEARSTIERIVEEMKAMQTARGPDLDRLRERLGHEEDLTSEEQGLVGMFYQTEERLRKWG